MLKLLYAAAGAAALATTSIANATITITDSGTTAGSILTIYPPDSGTPDTFSFDTSSDTAGGYASFIYFSTDQTGEYRLHFDQLYLITIESLAANGSVLLTDQITGGPGYYVLYPAAAGFRYTATLPTGGGIISGTFGVYAASAAVPEPATWAIMLLGFGAIGLTMRRKGALAQVARA